VVRHPATRWFHNLSINKITIHQGWQNIGTLSTQPNSGLSRICLISVPLLPVLHRPVCEGPMKMLHDKANRVSQSQSHCSYRNAHSLRYLVHWWEWLFIKCCPNCLISNVRTIDIGLAPLSGVQSSPLKYLVTVELTIAPGPRTAISYLWMIEADNSCLLRKRQIEC
jgi:hypothetical protein